MYSWVDMGHKRCTGLVQTVGQPSLVSRLISDEGATSSGPGHHLHLLPKAASKVMDCCEHQDDDLNKNILMSIK